MARNDSNFQAPMYLKDYIDYIELYLGFCGVSAKEWDVKGMAEEMNYKYKNIDEVPDDEFADLLVKYEL